MRYATTISSFSVMFVMLIPPPGPGRMNMPRASGAEGFTEATSNCSGGDFGSGAAAPKRNPSIRDKPVWLSQQSVSYQAFPGEGGRRLFQFHVNWAADYKFAGWPVHLCSPVYLCLIGLDQNTIRFDHDVP